MRADLQAGVAGEALEDLREIGDQEAQALRLREAADPGHGTRRVPPEAGTQEAPLPRGPSTSANQRLEAVQG